MHVGVLSSDQLQDWDPDTEKLVHGVNEASLRPGGCGQTSYT